MSVNTYKHISNLVNFHTPLIKLRILKLFNIRIKATFFFEPVERRDHSVGLLVVEPVDEVPQMVLRIPRHPAAGERVRNHALRAAVHEASLQHVFIGEVTRPGAGPKTLAPRACRESHRHS